jgi:hypothetical protein
MPLYGYDESIVAFDGFDDSVGSSRGNPQSVSQPFDSLMMHGVRPMGSCSEDSRQAGAFHYLYVVGKDAATVFLHMLDV